MKPYVYHSVEIVDFMAEPKQVTYILAAGGKGFFVLSDDTSRKSVVRRRTILGRLLDKDWRRGNTLNCRRTLPYKGLSSVSPSSELCAVNGEIFEGRNNYTLINETQINDNTSKIARLFAKPLLRQLEHYMVPDTMANQIRKYAEQNQVML